VREEESPYALIIDTHRFGPHSKGDDTRDPGLVAEMRSKYDPIQIQTSRLDAKEIGEVESLVDAEIATAFENAVNDPFPE
jgi:2-oxoisovalerate dehydrogenase E1 component